MADEKETKEVNYKYTADVSGLVSGVQKVIKSINQLSTPVKQTNFSTEMRKQFAAVVISANTMANVFKQDMGPVVQKMQAMKDKMVDIKKSAQKMSSTIAAAFKRSAKGVDTDTQSLKKHTKELNSGTTSTNKVNTAINNLTSSFKKLADVRTSISSLFTLISGFSAGDFFSEAISQATHYAEVLNMFNTVLGESTEAGQKFVDTMQEQYGLDPTSIMEYASAFYQLSSAVETPLESAKDMSLGLTKMIVDVSSLFDVSIDQVATNFESGMQGMTRAVRKYGLDIRMVTLEQTALNLGLSMNVETTSEANRQGLRYITMMKQMSVATGDFAKTIETPANQMRIMKEQITQLARAIGNLFLPVLQKVLPLINGFIMALRTVIGFFATLLGIETQTFGGMTDAASDLGSSITGIGTSAEDAAKKLKSLSAPFDELNVLQEESSSDSGSSGDSGLGGELMDPAIAEAIQQMQVEFEGIQMKANSVRDSLLDFFGFKYADVINEETGEAEKQLQWFADQFEANLIDKFPQWKNTITATFDTWPELISSISGLGSAILEAFKTAFAPAIEWIENIDWDSIVADWITDLPDKLNGITDWINNNQTLFTVMTGIITGFFLAFANFDSIMGAVRILMTVVNVLKTLAGLFNPITVAIALVVGAFVLAYQSSEDVRQAVSDLGDQFKDTWDAIGTLVDEVWTSTLKPIFDNLVENLKEFYEEHLSKLLESVSLVVTHIVEFLLVLIQGIAELLTYAIDTFGPMFASVFNTISDVVFTVIGAVTDVLNGLVEILDGIIDFLIGVFTGDWDRAWKGVKKVFKGIVDTFAGVFKGALNLLIDVANGILGLIWSGIVSLINKIKNSAVGQMADKIGISFGGDLPEQIPIKIPHFLAKGGVVTSPTLAMIGEGKYDEAVIPLGDSPQLKSLVQQIVDAINNDPNNSGSGGGVIDITLQLDGDTIYRNQQKVAERRGFDFGTQGGFAR